MNTLPIPTNFKMSPKIRHKWIKALKSGKYKQCRRAIRIGDRYDVIGVLCDVLYPKEWLVIHQTHYTPKGWKDHGIYTHKLNRVLYEAQISDDNFNKLCKLNDVDQLSFAQIAEWISQNI
jgi:hypothetical protein